MLDCHRNKVPVLAIAAHIPSSEIGSNYFQETHPQELFKECSIFCELISNPEQMPYLFETAMHQAILHNDVSVLVLPEDIALKAMPELTKAKWNGPQLAERAGIPAGVFNVVAGDDSRGMGKVLTQHPDIAKFTFTGSTAVGKTLIEQCASTVKKVSMKLGGNAPFIVFDDADIDAAVQGAIASKYRNAGQTCICTNRIFVQSAALEEFTDKFKTAVASLNIGDGLTEGVEIGPMISSSAVDGVNKLVTDSVALGAKVLLGGQRDSAGNTFYQPTVLTNVSNDMPIARDEIFGPISPIIAFDTEDQVLAMANDCEVGLAAYFYSRDISRVWRVAEGLEYGMVGINEAMISNAAAPFGGIKQSGSGREGSKYGLDDYLEIKYLCMGGLNK